MAQHQNAVMLGDWLHHLQHRQKQAGGSRLKRAEKSDIRELISLWIFGISLVERLPRSKGRHLHTID